MRAGFMVLLIWFCTPVWAQTLPEAVLKEVTARPEPFLTLAADLIHGYGQDGAIDAKGVDTFVALERAEARASALRRLQAADLDFDGAVTSDEMAVLAATLSAKARGRQWALLERADLDGNRTVSTDEIAGFGRAEAMRGFSPQKEAIVRAVLTFDSDADGKVTLDEVKAAVAALGV